MIRNRSLLEKFKEAAASVLPVVVIVFVACLLLVPVNTGLMLSFVVGALLLVVGMGLFGLGADMAMSRIGSAIGSAMTRSKKLWLILLLSFLLGAAITMAEPDLQVLAASVPTIENRVLVLTVSAGVGLFLALCMLRTLFGISLRLLLIVLYGLVFLGAALTDGALLSVAFDAGGVTTGPMTVPFIMALGVGVTSIRSDGNAKADSFGLVALCSVGPVLSVMLLSVIFRPDAAAAAETVVEHYETTTLLGWGYLARLPAYVKEVGLALLPIFGFFILFQCLSLHMRKKPLLRILVGIAYTYVGLVLFLTGVNVGFAPLGYELGAVLTEGWRIWLLVPLAALMGWFIINAEPAVHVLNRQVEELSAGAISAKAMGLSLSIGISAAMGLSMLRVITGLPLMALLIPGYGLALLLSFFVPPTFTAIAFDSGGVASGPLTAAFMLPLAVGACTALGHPVMTDAFGLVALVAMMPLITVQTMGAISVVKSRRRAAPSPADFGDTDIIELWEVA